MWRLWKRQPKEAKEKQNEEESLGKGYQPSSSSSWSISQPASGKKRRKSKKPKGKAIEAEESLQKGVGKVRRASAHAAQRGPAFGKGQPCPGKGGGSERRWVFGLGQPGQEKGSAKKEEVPLEKDNVGKNVEVKEGVSLEKDNRSSPPQTSPRKVAVVDWYETLKVPRANFFGPQTVAAGCAATLLWTAAGLLWGGMARLTGASSWKPMPSLTAMPRWSMNAWNAWTRTSCVLPSRPSNAAQTSGSNHCLCQLCTSVQRHLEIWRVWMNSFGKGITLERWHGLLWKRQPQCFGKGITSQQHILVLWKRLPTAASLWEYCCFGKGTPQQPLGKQLLKKSW